MNETNRSKGLLQFMYVYNQPLNRYDNCVTSNHLDYDQSVFFNNDVFKVVRRGQQQSFSTNSVLKYVDNDRANWINV